MSIWGAILSLFVSTYLLIHSIKSLSVNLFLIIMNFAKIIALMGVTVYMALSISCHLLTGTLGLMKGNINHDSKLNTSEIEPFVVDEKRIKNREELVNSTLTKLSDNSNTIITIHHSPTRPSFRAKIYGILFGKTIH